MIGVANWKLKWVVYKGRQKELNVKKEIIDVVVLFEGKGRNLWIRLF
jgi:hypothetical protein